MLEALRQLFFGRPTSQIALDLLDILLVAYLAYRVLLALKGTRAMQMVTGLVVLAGVYLAGRWIGLVTLTNVLSTLLSSIIVVVVVVFQNDLRRALSRAGTRPLFRGLTRDDEARVIEEIVAAVTELARLRYGAIITWERDANLDEFVMGAGTPIDAQVTRELLVTTFVPVAENKLHDGAVIIRSLRIAHAGVFFPMPEKLGLDKQFGSRHRAAIGITADTDAIAIVVSEERGTIMFCFQENHVDNVTPDQLRNLLRRYEQPKKKKAPKASVGPGSSRRSLPPPPLVAPVSVPPVAASPTKTSGAHAPVSIPTPPPGSLRPSVPPASQPLPPEEGLDQ
ncbi:MAG: TIGR00159 family protein [Myxococcales bacterium]|nr:TIGR00159 family protein [Myxococcales bacterium]